MYLKHPIISRMENRGKEVVEDEVEEETEKGEYLRYKTVEIVVKTISRAVKFLSQLLQPNKSQNKQRLSSRNTWNSTHSNSSIFRS